MRTSRDCSIANKQCQTRRTNRGCKVLTVTGRPTTLVLEIAMAICGLMLSISSLPPTHPLLTLLSHQNSHLTIGMASFDFTQVSDEDMATAYGIAQSFDLDDPSDIQIASILQGLHKDKTSISSTTVEPPSSAGFPRSEIASSSASSHTDDGLQEWGGDFSPRSYTSEIVVASPTFPKKKDSPSADTDMTTSSEPDDRGKDPYQMSGALHPFDRCPSKLHNHAKFNDSSTVCDTKTDSLKDFANQQPFRILNRDTIYEWIHSEIQRSKHHL